VDRILSANSTSFFTVHVRARVHSWITCCILCCVGWPAEWTAVINNNSAVSTRLGSMGSWIVMYNADQLWLIIQRTMCASVHCVCGLDSIGSSQVSTWHTYTPWVKKTRHLTLAHNFTKYWPIFQILSLLDSVGNCNKVIYKKTPPHPKRVATLPCEISVFKKSPFLKSKWSKLLCKT